MVNGSNSDFADYGNIIENLQNKLEELKLLKNSSAA